MLKKKKRQRHAPDGDVIEVMEREEVFAALGLSPFHAGRAAVARGDDGGFQVDAGELAGLIDRGCPPDTAYRILM